MEALFKIFTCLALVIVGGACLLGGVLNPTREIAETTDAIANAQATAYAQGTPLAVKYLHRDNRSDLSAVMVFHADSPSTTNYRLTIGSVELDDPYSNQSVNVTVNDGQAVRVLVPARCAGLDGDPDWQTYSGIEYCSTPIYTQLHKGDNIITLSSNTAWEKYGCTNSSYCTDIEGIKLEPAN